MTTLVEDSFALACIPQAIPVADRTAHFALGKVLLVEQARECVDLPDGYAFRFATEDFDSIARFVSNERKCCPFMSFDIHIDPDSGAIWLRMSGPEGTREVLQAELSLSGPCRCGTSTTAADDSEAAVPQVRKPDKQPRERRRLIKWMAVGGVLASLGVCAAGCLLPFLLLSVGISGAWVSNMDALGPYKWIFVAIAAAVLGYGFFAAYRQPVRRSAFTTPSDADESPRNARVALWIGVALAIGGVAFSYVEPYF